MSFFFFSGVLITPQGARWPPMLGAQQEMSSGGEATHGGDRIRQIALSAARGKGEGHGINPSCDSARGITVGGEPDTCASSIAACVNMTE